MPIIFRGGPDVWVTGQLGHSQLRHTGHHKMARESIAQPLKRDYWV